MKSVTLTSRRLAIAALLLAVVIVVLVYRSESGPAERSFPVPAEVRPEVSTHPNPAGLGEDTEGEKLSKGTPADHALPAREELKRTSPSDLDLEQQQKLRRLLNDVVAGATPEVRIVAIQELGTWGFRPEISQALLRAAREGPEDVRFEAVAAFLVVRDYTAVDELKRIARDDPSARVREEAEKVGEYLTLSHVEE